MFTGIITDVGEVLKQEAIPAGQRVRIATNFDPETIALGASIACNGVCHTVVEAGTLDKNRNYFSVESARETLDLTNASNWTEGSSPSIWKDPSKWETNWAAIWCLGMWMVWLKS